MLDILMKMLAGRQAEERRPQSLSSRKFLNEHSRFLLLIIFPRQTKDLDSLKIFLQAAAMMRCFVHLLTMSAVIPIAFSVTAGDAGKSGALIASTQLMYPVGALFAFLVSTKLSSAKTTALILSFFFLANAYTCAFSCDFLQGDGLVYALFATRFVHGFLSGGLGVVLEARALSVTPPEEMSGFFQLNMVGSTLGPPDD